MSNVPSWVSKAVPHDKLEEAKQAAIAEELVKLAAMDAKVAETLAMKANVFEVVPVK